MKKNLKSEYANKLIENGIKPYSVVRHSYTNNRLKGDKPIDTVQSVDTNLSPTLDTRCDCLGVAVESVRLIGDIGEKKSNGGTQFYEQDRVYDSNGLATSIPTSFHPNYLTHTHTQESKMNLRIRKLTPKECLALMGFDNNDYQSIKSLGLSDAAIYHMAGDSIISTCLMALFGQMLPISEKELKEKIEKYVETLKEN